MNKRSAFIIGKNAAARAGNCSPRYVCPLCLTSFYEYDETVLTEEHVPAKSLGGRGLILTCVTCNNDGGSLLQGDQSKKRKIEHFWAGKLEGRLNVEIETEQGILRGEGNFTGKDNVDMFIQAHRMNPSETEKLREHANTLKYKNFTVGAPFNQSRARIADLRDAYLWVFARYGYRAIANPWLDWARAAIKEGSTEVTKWAINLQDSHTDKWQKEVGGPIICWLDKPSGALLVCNGKSGVIFPTVFNTDPYASLGSDEASLQVGSKVEKVPDSMNMGMDFSDSFSVPKK